MKKKILVLVALLCLLMTSAFPAAAASYRRSEPLFFTGRVTYTVENNSSEPALNIVLTVPGICPEPFPYQVVVTAYWNRERAAVRRDERGNLLVEFHIPRLEAGASTEIVLNYLVKNFNFSFNLAESFGPYPAPPAYTLQPEEKVESDHPEIIAKAQELTRGKTTTLEKVKEIYAFVQQNLVYGGNYANRGALSALRTRSGVCEDYAALFVALCRAAGIPARMVFGITYNTESGKQENHAWAEFFLESHGWVAVEPTVSAPHVPWVTHFGTLPPEQRNVPLSLTRNSWRWSWQGPGTVKVGSTSQLAMGQNIPLFNDMDGHWAKEVAEALAYQGLVITEESGFLPNKPITRAEVALLLVLAHNLEPLFVTPTFKDVKTSDWFHPYVEAARKAGLFAGFEDNTFRGNEPITREQMAAVLSRCLGFDGIIARGTSLPYVDRDSIAGWALPSVIYCTGIKLFGGDDLNRFRPKDFCSRAEAASLFQRYINLRR